MGKPKPKINVGVPSSFNSLGEVSLIEWTMDKSWKDVLDNDSICSNKNNL